MSFIKRVQPTRDEEPPWAGMSFTQPVDSDALHEQLKVAYPECGTFRERKHMAAIDFLKGELLQMQLKEPNLAVTTQSTEYVTFASPEAHDFSSDAVRGRSRQGSLSITESPASSTKFSASVERFLERRGSDTTSAITSTTDSGQQFVFSATDGRTMQPKTKRKMTKEEKSAYKETRKRGACLKCKRQKGKCTHAINTVMEFDSPPELRSPPKRHISSGPNVDRAERSKSARLNHASNVHRIAHDLSRQEEHPLLDSSMSDNGPPNQLGIAPGDTEWESELHERGPSEMPGYVHPELPIQSYGVSLPSDHGAAWTSFTDSSGVDTFNPGYPAYMEDVAPSDGTYTLSPSRNDLPGFPYSTQYSGYHA